MSTRTNKSLGYPTIGVCSVNPYRQQVKMMTLDQMEAMTFTPEEMVYELKPSRDLYNVSTIYTLHSGRCVLLRPSHLINYTTWISFLAKMPFKVSLLSEGQELCLIMDQCPHERVAVSSDHGIMVANLHVQKRVLPHK